jgi:Arm domain-containing DNA-binding protein
METKMNVLFFLRKAKMTKDKQSPIYPRVTIRGKRFEVSTDKFIDPVKWAPKAGGVRGKSEEFRTCHDEGLENVPLFFVHQLQNLCFDLTGAELSEDNRVGVRNS